MSTHIDHDEGVRLAFSADASGLHLVPEGVARPTSIEEVVEVVRRAAADRTPITPAGAQTSYTGASITDRGVVLSLRAMDRVLDVDPAARTARVQPGAFVGDVKRAIAEHGLLFAPDPTSEDESSIGGAIACNSSGARSLRYGPTRPHIRALTIVLADGTVTELRRPQLEKNTAGYTIVHDPVDWFIGSEGTLGVVVEAELALLPLPGHVTGLGIPFATERDALAFVVAARDSADVQPRCLEFLDERAFAIARAYHGGEHWAAGAKGFVYTEQEADDEDAVPLDAWLALAEAHGGLGDDVQVFQGDAGLREARAMRHTVPARLNERAAGYRAAGGRKVSTDWAVPYRRLHEALEAGHAIADRHGIDRSVTFGHAGNGHPHQHFLVRDAAELERTEEVVGETLRHVLGMGGTVAAEHGIGKLKSRWLSLQLTPLQLRVMRAVKHELDPDGIMSPGNVL